MSKGLELYKQALRASDEHEVAMQKAMTALQRSRMAWNELTAMYSGKSREELVEIWESEFADWAREYCQQYPNAMDWVNYSETSRRTRRWVKTLAAKRTYFLERMLGRRMEKTSITKPAFTTTGSLVAHIQKYAQETCDRIDQLRPEQRKALQENILKPLAHALYPYKEELKKTRLICFCGKKNTSYNGVDCSQTCMIQRTTYERHQFAHRTTTGADYAKSA